MEKLKTVMPPDLTSNYEPNHLLRRRILVRFNKKEEWVALKGNRLYYLGIKKSMVSTNLSRVNFKILLSHNPSSHEEFPSQDLFCI